MKPVKTPDKKSGILYLIRHGAALHGQDDDARPLSSQGVSEAKALAVLLKQDGIPAPDVLWTSSKKRARETARILADSLGCPVEEGYQWLLPESSADQAADNIDTYFIERPSGILMIVSHMPLLPQLAAVLAPGSCGSGAALPTAGCLCFEKTKSWQMDRLIVPGSRTFE